MRGRVSNAVLVVAAGFAVVLVLVGCGGGEKDASGPPTPISTPTTPSPGESRSVAPPKIPAAAQERNESGAKEFLTFFFDEVNRGSTAPGTVDLFAISDPECRACRKMQDVLQTLVDDGVYVKVNPLRVLDIALNTPGSEVPNAEKVLIDFTYEQQAVPTYRGEKNDGDLEPYKETRRAALRWVDGAWEMFDMEVPPNA